MEQFARIIRKDDVVVEVGAHIGFISQYFAQLVGDQGKVHVFEPGPNNLPYLRRNVGGRANVQIVEVAASDRTGTARFYLEDLTGQNNSILPNYEILDRNANFAGVRALRREIEVPCATLDSLFLATEEPPTFFKIDVEGAELQVLGGMREILSRGGVILMVEVTAENRRVWDLLREFGFRFFHPTGWEITMVEDFAGNVFCSQSSTLFSVQE